MRGFARVDEGRGGARRREGGGDLSGNVTGLAHPAHHQLPPATMDHQARLDEILVERMLQQVEGFAFRANDLATPQEDGFALP